MSDDGPSRREREPDSVLDHVRIVLSKLKAWIGQGHANPSPHIKSLPAEVDPEHNGSGSGGDL
jgi:hypothetical protein